MLVHSRPSVNRIEVHQADAYDESTTFTVVWPTHVQTPWKMVMKELVMTHDLRIALPGGFPPKTRMKVVILVFKKFPITYEPFNNRLFSTLVSLISIHGLAGLGQPPSQFGLLPTSHTISRLYIFILTRSPFLPILPVSSLLLKHRV